MTLAQQINACLILSIISAALAGISLGRYFGHRDRVRLQIHRILEWYT
jgi:hypothetical protein